MGMDLTGVRPKNAKGDEFSVNWTGWRTIESILYQLGCDTSEMSGSNDGERISARTCKDWAKAIREALNERKIVIQKVPDKIYFGGFRREFIVLSESNKLNENVKIIKEKLKTNDLQYFNDGEFFFDEWAQEWLESFCDFLENCGGCRQY